MSNKKLSLAAKVAGFESPPVVFDLTQTDVVESQLEKAIALVDLGDVEPGDGAAEFVVTVKKGSFKIPIVLTLDVVE